MLIKKDELILFTDRDYDDCDHVFLGRARKGFDLALLQAQYLAARPKQRTEGTFSKKAFTKWLMVKGLMVEVEYGEADIKPQFDAGDLLPRRDFSISSIGTEAYVVAPPPLEVPRHWGDLNIWQPRT